MGKTRYNFLFSRAMLNYQRVYQVPSGKTICELENDYAEVDFPIDSMVTFHSYSYISLPEGMYINI